MVHKKDTSINYFTNFHVCSKSFLLKYLFKLEKKNPKNKYIVEVYFSCTIRYVYQKPKGCVEGGKGSNMILNLTTTNNCCTVYGDLVSRVIWDNNILV